MTPPFLYGTVETKEIPHPCLDGERRLSVRVVKVDQKGLFTCHENVLKLKISVEKTSLMKLSNQKADGSNCFSLRGNAFEGRMCSRFVKILNQIRSTGNFHGKKISLVEPKEDGMVNCSNGGNRRNSARSDLLG